MDLFDVCDFIPNLCDRDELAALAELHGVDVAATLATAAEILADVG